MYFIFWKKLKMITGHSDVVSVFPDAMLQHTTRWWDFIEGRAGRLSKWGLDKRVSSDIIIGIIDTGKFIIICIFYILFYFYSQIKSS